MISVATPTLTLPRIACLFIQVPPAQLYLWFWLYLRLTMSIMSSSSFPFLPLPLCFLGSLPHLVASPKPKLTPSPLLPSHSLSPGGSLTTPALAKALIFSCLYLCASHFSTQIWFHHLLNKSLSFFMWCLRSSEILPPCVIGPISDHFLPQVRCSGSNSWLFLLTTSLLPGFYPHVTCLNPLPSWVKDLLVQAFMISPWNWWTHREPIYFLSDLISS